MKTLTTTRFFQLLAETFAGQVALINEFNVEFEKFTQMVATLCDQMDNKTTLRILNYTKIKLRTFRKEAVETRLPKPIINYIIEAEQFINAEIKIIYCIFQYPEHFIMDNAPITSPLHWSKKYHAVDLSEILCSFDLMSPRPIILSDGREAPFYLVIQHFEQFLNVKLGNPGDIKRRVLERKKDRTKFTKVIFHTLNDDENE